MKLLLALSFLPFAAAFGTMNPSSSDDICSRSISGEDTCQEWVRDYGCDTVWGDVCTIDHPSGNEVMVSDGCPHLCDAGGDGPCDMATDCCALGQEATLCGSTLGTKLAVDNCAGWTNGDGSGDKVMPNEGESFRTDEDMYALGHTCHFSCGDANSGHQDSDDPGGGIGCENVFKHYGSTMNCCPMDESGDAAGGAGGGSGDYGDATGGDASGGDGSGDYGATGGGGDYGMP